MGYNFSKTSNSLIATLDTESGKYDEHIIEFFQPVLSLGQDRIVLSEGSLRKLDLVFGKIGEIDGETPSNLIDGFELLESLIKSIFIEGGGGVAPLEKLSDLIDNNLNFNITDFDITGSATYSIEGGKLKASGGGTFDFDSKALHKNKSNVENFTAELDWYLSDTRTSGTYGLAFSLRSIGQFYEYGYQMLYDASIGNANSGKLNVYFFSNGGIVTNIHLSSVVIPMNANDKMRYTIHRNKNNYVFMIENLTQNKRSSFYFKSAVSVGYSGTRIVNNICRFGVAKQTAEDVDFFVERLNVKRDLNKNYDFSFNDCFALCSNLSSAQAQTNAHTSHHKTKEIFENGTWKGKDFELAQEWADKIRLIKPYYNGYNRSSFVGVMVILLQNKIFDFNEFMHKIRLQPTALVNCADRHQYRTLIEDIYNYRSRQKVNLKY